MEQGRNERPVRRVSQYDRYKKRPHSRKQKNDDGWGGFGSAVFISILLFSIILKFINVSPVNDMKSLIVDKITGGMNYKDAIEVIGRALTEKDGISEVFGSGAGSLNEDQNKTPKQAEKPVENSESKEGEPGTLNDAANSGSDSAANEASTGSIMKIGDGAAADTLLFEKYGQMIDESEMPQTLSDALLNIPISEEDRADDTPSGPFYIPSPDIVDDRVYTLPFVYKAPLKGTVSSPFGYRDHPIDGNTKFHFGIDVAVKSGTPVLCFAAGTIYETGVNSIYGKYVTVKHSDGFSTFYGHLSKVYVKEGQKVKISQKIALSGNTGVSTGPHLHFEIRKNGKKLNPANYVSF